MMLARTALVVVALSGVSGTVPVWNETKCPAFWELQRPGMENFAIEDLAGFYYELAFHDVTQYPLCPGKSHCITSQKTIQTHSDGVKFVNDTWNLQCFGHPYPQTLLFNVTEHPGFLRGYVPKTVIPFLPKDVVANTVFPDTLVDFKPGPEGWALEMQCVEVAGHVAFIGINYYSKLKTEAAFQGMDKAARARGLGFYMDKGFGLRRVDHSNCPLEPHSADSEMKGEKVEEKVAEPCCENACKAAGTEKYYSIAASMTGVPHCGECCMDPKKYGLYHLFEKNLTKASTDTPCSDFGYTKYDSTVTHGFGPVKMTLDLYDLPKVEKVEEKVAEPCCENACKAAGTEKYYSIAASMTGVPHCGECCMDPKKYSLYHFFEKNLTKASTATPCSDFGYTKYDSTVTHGFGPVKMTLDLYDLPKVEKVEEKVAEPCCENACKAVGTEKYYSIAASMTGVPHCGECCMDPKKYGLYHLFEKNLTKASTATPCSDFGYTKYDSTVTHGFGPVKMTLDLYDLPKFPGAMFV